MAETPTRSGILKGLQTLFAVNTDNDGSSSTSSESPLKKTKTEHDFSFTPRKSSSNAADADFITSSPQGSQRQGSKTKDVSKFSKLVPKKLQYDDEPAPSEKSSGVMETIFSPVYNMFMKHFEGEENAHAHKENHVISAVSGEDQVYNESNSERSSSTSDGDSATDSECNNEPVVYQQDVEEEEEDASEDAGEFDPFLFISSLPPLTLEQTTRDVGLPPKSTHAPKITLVLDLDETLVHCSTEHIANPDLTFAINFKGNSFNINVRTRPHLKEFMEYITDRFEVIVFTASLSVYADTLLDHLDPKRKCFRHRMFRESCIAVDGNYLKELSALNRSLSNTVIVDNCISAFSYNLENGIPIESWYDDKSDTELLKLIPFLEHLRTVDDVRPAVLKKYRLHENIPNFVPNFS